MSKGVIREGEWGCWWGGVGWGSPDRRNPKRQVVSFLAGGLIDFSELAPAPALFLVLAGDGQTGWEMRCVL